MDNSAHENAALTRVYAALTRTEAFVRALELDVPPAERLPLAQQPFADPALDKPNPFHHTPPELPYRRPPLPPASEKEGEEGATRQLVADVLAEAARHRHIGVTGGLYTLAELAPFARLGHGLPTLRGTHGATFHRAADDSEFAARMAEEAPFLATFDFCAHGMRLAGGAVSALLMHRPFDARTMYHDFDLFLVGHADDEEARGAIRALAAHLWAAWGQMEVHRTQNALSFLHEEEGGARRIVQAILRRYASEAEILHGFDVGSCSFMWDGRRVTATRIGVLAAERGANVLDLAVRRASYERRLAQYFERGFDLVLPALNGRRFLALEGQLRYLRAEGLERRACACDLAAQTLIPRYPAGGQPEEASAYEYKPRVCAVYADLILHNLEVVFGATGLQSGRASAVRTAALRAWAPYTPELPLFTFEPAFQAPDLAFLARSRKQDRTGLRLLLGEEGARRVELDIASNLPTPEEVIIDFCAARCAAARLHARIPAQFLQAEQATALGVSPAFPLRIVSEQDWYGGALHGCEPL
jgi:hypothetical protein